MSTPPETVAGAVARRPGEPAPDLLDYRVVHRAMTVDLDRLAAAAAELVERPDPARMAVLREFLRAISGEIESHHHVEDEHVWPFLQEIAGERTALVPLTEDHERLDPLLHLAGELAAQDTATPQLAAVLREVSDLLTRHVADEERDVFPIIEDHVRVEDYERLQRRFRGNLKLGLLPFLVPWAMRHATAEERPALLAGAGPLMRLLLALFEPRFLAREELLFGPNGLTRKDRKLVTTMRWFGPAHTFLLRRTGGRIGGRWFGGTAVLLLTVRGRTSGRLFTVPLMCLPHGGDLVVVASQGGVDRQPQWWLNLLSDPRAEVELHGRRFPVTASEIVGDERSELWDRFVAATDRFEQYQAGVRRRIAVVRLRPTT